MDSTNDRWEWEGTPAAASVPPWMRVGTGRDGALHHVASFLSAIRRSEQAAGHPEWAFVSAHDIDDSGRVHGVAIAELLHELHQHGVVEPSDAEPRKWRATAGLVAQIDEAYRARHPMSGSE